MQDILVWILYVILGVMFLCFLALIPLAIKALIMLYKIVLKEMKDEKA